MIQLPKSVYDSDKGVYVSQALRVVLNLGTAWKSVSTIQNLQNEHRSLKIILNL